MNTEQTHPAVAEIADSVAQMLSKRWDSLCDLSKDEDGQPVEVRVAFAVRIGFGATTKVTVAMSYSTRVKDEVNFSVDDPAQTKMDLDK